MTTGMDFKYIDPELYRHPGEREALARLGKIPGFAKILAMLSDNSGAKAERQSEVAGMARVGSGVYPLLSQLWNAVQNRFGLNGVPLHVAFELSLPSAVRGGNDAPSVLLDRSMLSLPEPEMEALLSMQAGSIRLGNATCLMAADFLRRALDLYGVAGAAAALPAWGLENWRRCALFSADRAAALSRGDPEGVSAFLVRLAGAGEAGWGGVTRPDDLRLQGIEALSHERDRANGALRRFALAMNRRSHVALIRRMDLLDWFGGGVPAKILSGEIVRPEDANPGGASSSARPDVSPDDYADPGLAYWGEFAGEGQGKEGGQCFFKHCPMSGAASMTEKGVQSFVKAGEAFWNTLWDKK